VYNEARQSITRHRKDKCGFVGQEELKEDRIVKKVKRPNLFKRKVNKCIYKMSASNVFKVAECVELMDKVNNISAILDDSAQLIPEGVYLKLYDELKSLYNTELILKVDKYAKKKAREMNGRVRHSQQQYRILASQFPEKYAICPICETGMLKENIKLHYQTTQKCRDIYYTKRGVEICMECIDPQIASMITEIYGEPVPPLPQDLIDAGQNAPNYAAMGGGQ
jgi:hypothetical protein|tara:strand:- start:10371 stop:11039 length:669 start_codon:yes stop_codon:yes gene_type:complete